MKPLVIYHANCTDGFGAAFAAWAVLGDDAEYVPCHYGDGNFTNPQDIRDRVDGRTVYILDFSLPRPAMDQMFADAGKVVWLDHHKTAFEMMDDWNGGPTYYIERPNVTATLNNGKSGALLAWEYFHPDTPAPDLIRMIDDRDRWQFKLPSSRALHAGLQLSRPWTFESWAALLKYEKLFAEFVDQGDLVLQVYDEQIKSAVKRAEGCSLVPPIIDAADSYKAPWVWWVDPEFGDTCGARGLAVNSAIHQSEIGHELAIASGTYGLVWYYDAATRRANCSLRSNGDYDVSAIAKAFGGGGHKNAAGFNTDMWSLLDWLGG